jgi:DNA-binding transcriptional MocR family regulator
MTADRADDVRRAGARRRRLSAGVLADRMAATLVHHEPGWRLPRLTAMARRFNVSAAEVDAAIDDLAARHLLRRLPDGQVYRAVLGGPQPAAGRR